MNTSHRQGRLIDMFKKCIAAILIIASLPALLPLKATGDFDIGKYPHYLKENDARYHAFRTQNPALQYDMVIAYVNANVDIGFYNEIVTVQDPKSITVLVNKNFNLPDRFVPDDMKNVEGGHKLRTEAAEHYLKMKADIFAAGLKIYIISSYRSYQTQAGKHSNAVINGGLTYADSQYARPGHSEHQTGLAVDVAQRTNFSYMTQAQFEETPEYQWLTMNAYKYGFILRYPKEYENIHGFIYEPWHWRYVGVDVATAMYNDGIVMFEEYYGWFLAPGVQEKNANEEFTHTRNDGNTTK